MAFLYVVWLPFCVSGERYMKSKQEKGIQKQVARVERDAPAMILKK